jgi:hypothetical protein
MAPSFVKPTTMVQTFQLRPHPRLVVDDKQKLNFEKKQYSPPVPEVKVYIPPTQKLSPQFLHQPLQRDPNGSQDNSSDQENDNT